MKYSQNKKLILAILIASSLILIIVILLYLAVFAPRQKMQNFTSFKEYINSLYVPNETLVDTTFSSSGCFKDDSGAGLEKKCTFLAGKFYVLSGDGNASAENISVTLRQRGFDLKVKRSDNLSEFYNSQNNTTLYVRYGTKQRIIADDSSIKTLKQIPDGQLIAQLVFNRVDQ